MPKILQSSSSISFRPSGALINTSVHLLDGQLISDSYSQKEGYAIKNPHTSHRKQPQLTGPVGVFGEAIARAAKVAQIAQEIFMLALHIISYGVTWLNKWLPAGI
ncbi:hypothetical protein H106_06765 [Trichophyton rubrum CBS 735.88]|nr:hypothetical protein H106_06765 [Trichophyton rubrum CBS 735.88]KMQ48543.1 hypothetical protein HL42_0640 [Trichophyton rubrum]